MDTDTAQLKELNIMMRNMNAKADDMMDSPMAVQARFEGIAVSEIQTAQFNSTTAHIAISVKQEPWAATKEDLNEIRKDLLMLMTGQRAQVEKQSNVPSFAAARLSDADKLELAGQISQELLKNPSTLKSSCDFVSGAGIQSAKLPLHNISPYRSAS